MTDVRNKFLEDLPKWEAEAEDYGMTTGDYLNANRALMIYALCATQPLLTDDLYRIMEIRNILSSVRVELAHAIMHKAEFEPEILSICHDRLVQMKMHGGNGLTDLTI